MKPKTPQLINAAAMASAHPATFEVPSKAVLAGLKPGRLVKVAVRLGTNAERFWVELTEIKGAILTGRIDNDLLGAGLHGLAYNDTIRFSSANVYAVSPT